MHPIPCSHCASNFMRHDINPESPKLCNNCLLKEENRHPKKKENMEPTIEIQIKCPLKVHNEIEEYCINFGLNLTEYFLKSHFFLKENWNQSNKSSPILEASVNLLHNSASLACEKAEEQMEYPTLYNDVSLTDGVKKKRKT